MVASKKLFVGIQLSVGNHLSVVRGLGGKTENVVVVGTQVLGSWKEATL